MNYQVYNFNRQEWCLYILEGIILAAGISYVFYHSFIAFFLLIPCIYFFIKWVKKNLILKRSLELSLEFREAIISVQSALNAGYSVENAFIEAGRDMEKLYGREGLISREFTILTRRLRSNETLEKILTDLSDRSGIEDIRDFANVFSVAKRGGGDFTSIIRRAADTIGDKIEVRREIDTLMSSKRYENRIMEIVPFAIILYLGFTSPDLISVLYHNVTGIAIMTVCLMLYGFAFYLAERIVSIEI
ncbi:MAG: type II secretion system F family protein [Lachnospiraceae bacterium]|nr:type II secretion system F family protein [Lachnospiraceae bacterium]